MPTQTQKKETELSETQRKYAYDHPVLSWEVPEFIKHDRGKLWFIIAGCVLALIFIYSLSTNSWSTAVAFLVVAGVYYMHHHHEPRIIKITISQIGIKADTIEIPFSQIRYFWMIYEPPHVKTLHIATTKRTMPELTIQLGYQNPAELRNYLTQQIPEMTGKQESFTHLITRLLKL